MRSDTAMIAGKVTTDQEAVITLEVAGPGQAPQLIQAVIDTGYNGDLTLPGHLISVLQLPFAGHRRATLADGSVVVLNMHLATVGWHGTPRDVLISQAEGAPLVGMALLRGSRLTLDVIDDGDVAIDALP